jgi:hypothetical protein
MAGFHVPRERKKRLKLGKLPWERGKAAGEGPGTKAEMKPRRWLKTGFGKNAKNQPR